MNAVKGQRLFPRLLRHLSHQQGLTLLTLLTATYIQLDVVRRAPPPPVTDASLLTKADRLDRAKREVETDNFLHCVIPGVDMVINRCDLGVMAGLLNICSQRMDLSKVASTRVGPSSDGKSSESDPSCSPESPCSQLYCQGHSRSKAHPPRILSTLSSRRHLNRVIWSIGASNRRAFSRTIFTQSLGPAPMRTSYKLYFLISPPSSPRHWHRRPHLVQVRIWWAANGNKKQWRWTEEMRRCGALRRRELSFFERVVWGR